MTWRGKDVGREQLEAAAPPEDEPAIHIGKGTRDLGDHRHPTLSLNDENLTSIAHDLRRPLSIIELETTQLLEALGPLGLAAAQRSLRRISQNAMFMAHLVEDLLELARAESGMLRLDLQHADLSRVVKEVVERCVSTADHDRVSIELSDALTASIDSTRIERVVGNFLDNALAHAPPKSPVIIRLDAHHRCARVSVIDAGPGLTAEDARHVFERYWQRSVSQVGHGQVGQGLGLGLYVSRKIIEAHGGRIGVESAPGSGSSFFFELPVVST